MTQPISTFEKDLVKRLEAAGINTDITQRWESGTPHHPKAESLARQIGALDWMFCSDSFRFKFGGDGDNGESLAYLLDIYFELVDAEEGIK
jgi:hypothetical protein